MPSRPRICVLQPDPGVALDRFEGWLRAEGMSLSVIELWREPVPEAAPLDDRLGDGLLVLGGRMDVHDTAGHAWLVDVARLITAVHAQGIPVLGICLGHQLLAEALGGEVTVADAGGGEHGPAHIEWLPGAADDPVLGEAVACGVRIVPESHGDVVTVLPPGATDLARTVAYPHQAFRVGSALGVQFHPEASPVTMARWAELAGNDPAAMEATMAAIDDSVRQVGAAIARGFAAYVHLS